jgi:N-carbamoylputrescine amidase
MTLTVALLQLADHGADTQQNLHRGVDACRDAARMGADVALFPEMWQLGYADCPTDPEGRRRWLDAAIGAGDPWLQALRHVAREHDVAVLATYLQRWSGPPRNAATLIDRHGRDVLTYAKVHTCDWVFERWLTPGDGFPVADLDTRDGPVRVGVMICFDREFPEAARELMLAGAEVILTPNACPLTDDRIGQFRARAFENMVAVAMANYPRFGGRSCAFDGVAFAWPDGPPRDHCVVEAGPDEGIVPARIDIDALRAYRLAESWGDAYRKPGTYPRIAQTSAPRPPFSRPYARR